jgi:DNA polymerase III sliding clamp (beta) subunit (PCNA family)
VQLNGKFPDYQAVMPKETKNGAPNVHDLSSFSHPIRQLEFMVDHETSRMTVDYRQTGLHLSAQSQSGKCQVVIPCDVAVESKSNFNPKYLLDALKAIKTQEVTAFLTDSGQMILKSDNLTQLLMPLG